MPPQALSSIALSQIQAVRRFIEPPPQQCASD